jgi:hypothetical protein
VNGDPPVRFYCGTPLVASNGHRLGTLCFADPAPHAFDAERCSILNNMAELCVREIEREAAARAAAAQSAQADQARARSLPWMPHGMPLRCPHGMLDQMGDAPAVLYRNWVYLMQMRVCKHGMLHDGPST